MPLLDRRDGFFVDFILAILEKKFRKLRFVFQLHLLDTPSVCLGTKRDSAG